VPVAAVMATALNPPTKEERSCRLRLANGPPEGMVDRRDSAHFPRGFGAARTVSMNPDQQIELEAARTKLARYEQTARDSAKSAAIANALGEYQLNPGRRSNLPS